MLPWEDIKPRQIWCAADGSGIEVVILGVNQYEVTYMINSPCFSEGFYKNPISFQYFFNLKEEAKDLL